MPTPMTRRRRQRAMVQRVLGTFKRFFATAAAGGVVLLVCTAAALAWANSPWAGRYGTLWAAPLTIGTAGVHITQSLRQWVNDGLMTAFFLLVGLEIKREVLVGELASRRSAALPVAAAFGGMVVPALIYAGINAGSAGAPGWGIPMATDIAFALGILALLGERVPNGLRIFVAALAIADDLGAVLVIAVFYTSTLNWAALGGAAIVLALLILLNRAGVHRPAGYALLGVALWLCLLASGVHATIAGVLLALTIPARTRINEDEFLDRAETALGDFRAADEPGSTVLTNSGHQDAIQALESACAEVQAPLQRVEHALHGLVSFVIMPLFALANAGIPLGHGAAEQLASRVALGAALGLLIGKPIGITLASVLSVRAGFAELPAGVSWRQLHAVSWLGGIGFTMSLFIAGLAFGETGTLDIAKLGVLGGSLVAGAIGLTLLRAALPAPLAAADRSSATR
ncbi:MAG TPA: Na+/H+ antiporter NhaA [Gemmatimonadaceae bacterium]|nr:Na+/H+ antiporter NhaA [Gemmatimonadaceae bacterium]